MSTVLVPMHELLQQAEKEGYALPALNFCNLETMYSMLQAAQELRAPIILQAAASEVYYFGEDLMAECVRRASDQYGVAVALHLDHGREYKEAMKCIRRGFTSVMFDGSSLPYEQNVGITKSIVQAAHAVGVSVEGELGTIMGAEDSAFINSDAEALTDPRAAADFARETGVDALAVAIGTAHGFYKKEPKLDFERLTTIRKFTNNLPIVLHGGTGIPESSIKKAVSLGIRKINFSTIIRADFIQAFRQYSVENPEEYMLMTISKVAMNKVKEAVSGFITLLGCNNRV